MLAHGFARVRCESCKDELLVAFSCVAEKSG
ncbi:transposase zinc-binding domain-containing protein [Pyxidicoccus sp. QH1ED-7-1]|nr:transposase zinc-binding domain-containing protein [Pyxidicoccus xibeiensis]MCP3143597.1 transposase zinc-binding domain-containing protein [Pyxidicoccus xibeiensis]